MATVNQVLEGFSQTDRMALMDDMVTKQPVEKKAEDAKASFLGQMWAILKVTGSNSYVELE